MTERAMFGDKAVEDIPPPFFGLKVQTFVCPSLVAGPIGHKMLDTCDLK
jgi:hypothetical protein